MIELELYADFQSSILYFYLNLSVAVRQLQAAVHFRSSPKIYQTESSETNINHLCRIKHCHCDASHMYLRSRERHGGGGTGSYLVRGRLTGLHVVQDGGAGNVLWRNDRCRLRRRRHRRGRWWCGHHSGDGIVDLGRRLHRIGTWKTGNVSQNIVLVFSVALR